MIEVAILVILALIAIKYFPDAVELGLSIALKLGLIAIALTAAGGIWLYLATW